MVPKLRKSSELQLVQQFFAVSVKQLYTLIPKIWSLKSTKWRRNLSCQLYRFEIFVIQALQVWNICFASFTGLKYLWSKLYRSEITSDLALHIQWGSEFGLFKDWTHWIPESSTPYSYPHFRFILCTVLWDHLYKWLTRQTSALPKETSCLEWLKIVSHC